MKCENCNNSQATVHLTEIKAGKKIEKHLCEACASQIEGIGAAVKGHQPINELLTNFVMAHSGLAKEQVANCEDCGMSWAEFRQSGLLGCANDYKVFERELAPLIQRAHEGATHHIGKVPSRGQPVGVPARRRTVDMDRLRKDLARAVEAEDYERAAKIRDQIRLADQE
ncbi:MAG: UvrB/UvrC motif-containing protein [Burkholderiales bacterium]|nr:UvrB/UvrC motif-containing protein [Phycisphaerae bacterium]